MRPRSLTRLEAFDELAKMSGMRRSWIRRRRVSHRFALHRLRRPQDHRHRLGTPSADHHDEFLRPYFNRGRSPDLAWRDEVEAMKCEFCGKGMMRCVDEYASPVTGIRTEVYTWQCLDLNDCGHSFLDKTQEFKMTVADGISYEKVPLDRLQELKTEAERWAHNCGECETCSQYFGKAEGPTIDPQELHLMVLELIAIRGNKKG